MQDERCCHQLDPAMSPSVPADLARGCCQAPPRAADEQHAKGDFVGRFNGGNSVAYDERRAHQPGIENDVDFDEVFQTFHMRPFTSGR